MEMVDREGRKVVLMNGVWYRVEAGGLVRLQYAPEKLEALFEGAERGHA